MSGTRSPPSPRAEASGSASKPLFYPYPATSPLVKEHKADGREPWNGTLAESFASLRKQFARRYAEWKRKSVKRISAYPSNVSVSDLPGSGFSGTCMHTHREPHCVLYNFKGLLRGLIVGYGLKSGFAFALALFSRKLFSSPVTTLQRCFLSPDTFRFAKFLGAMGFTYRILQCLFCKIRGRPGKLNSTLAAFLSGATILMDSPERRSTIALYLFTRGLYEVARTAVYHGFAEEREHMIIGLFALCQVPIIYSFLREPWALAPSYHKFILSMGKVTAPQVAAILGPDVTYRPCQPIYHTGDCITWGLTDLLHAIFVRAPKIYLPVHIVPGLLFKFKHVMNEPGVFVFESLIGILRSCLFLGTYTGIVKSSVCFWRWLLGQNYNWAYCLTGLLTGLSLIFEHPRRHTELLMYVIPRALEAAANLYQDSYPRWLREGFENGYGPTALFMIAVASFVFCADTEPKLKSLNGTIFRLIFGPGTQMIPSDRYKRNHSASRLALARPPIGLQRHTMLGSSEREMAAMSHSPDGYPTPPISPPPSVLEQVDEM